MADRANNNNVSVSVGLNMLVKTTRRRKPRFVSQSKKSSLTTAESVLLQLFLLFFTPSSANKNVPDIYFVFGQFWEQGDRRERAVRDDEGHAQSK